MPFVFKAKSRTGMAAESIGQGISQGITGYMQGMQLAQQMRLGKIKEEQGAADKELAVQQGLLNEIAIARGQREELEAGKRSGPRWDIEQGAAAADLAATQESTAGAAVVREGGEFGLVVAKEDRPKHRLALDAELELVHAKIDALKTETKLAPWELKLKEDALKAEIVRINAAIRASDAKTEGVLLDNQGKVISVEAAKNRTEVIRQRDALRAAEKAAAPAGKTPGLGSGGSPSPSTPAQDMARRDVYERFALHDLDLDFISRTLAFDEIAYDPDVIAFIDRMDEDASAMVRGGAWPKGDPASVAAEKAWTEDRHKFLETLVQAKTHERFQSWMGELLINPSTNEDAMLLYFGEASATTRNAWIAATAAAKASYSTNPDKVVEIMSTLTAANRELYRAYGRDKRTLTLRKMLSDEGLEDKMHDLATAEAAMKENAVAPEDYEAPVEPAADLLEGWNKLLMAENSPDTTRKMENLYLRMYAKVNNLASGEVGERENFRNAASEFTQLKKRYQNTISYQRDDEKKEEYRSRATDVYVENRNAGLTDHQMMVKIASVLEPELGSLDTDFWPEILAEAKKRSVGLTPAAPAAPVVPAGSTPLSKVDASQKKARIVQAENEFKMDPSTFIDFGKYGVHPGSFERLGYIAEQIDLVHPDILNPPQTQGTTIVMRAASKVWQKVLDRSVTDKKQLDAAFRDEYLLAGVNPDTVSKEISSAAMANGDIGLVNKAVHAQLDKNVSATGEYTRYLVETNRFTTKGTASVWAKANKDKIARELTIHLANRGKGVVSVALRGIGSKMTALPRAIIDALKGDSARAKKDLKELLDMGKFNITDKEWEVVTEAILGATP